MSAYEVIVSSLSYRGNGPLTYLCDVELSTGAIVKIPLRNEIVMGVVVKKTRTIPPKAKAILEVAPWPPLPAELLRLHAWLLEYYGSGSGAVTQLILPSYLQTAGFKEFTSEPKTPKPAKQLPELTAQQTSALKSIQSSVSTYLLHGITGSGKTRVYAELARQVLAKQKSAIILVPEIGLSSQVGHHLEELLSDQTIVHINSHMTPASRRKAWLQILHSSGPLVVVGPRSALFTPVKSVGLVIVDEEHDGSYKQEQAPYYHANRAAAVLTKLHHASLVLGSATPTIGDYYLAQSKEAVVTMDSLAITNTNTHKTIVVDLAHKADFSKSRIISDPLYKSISEALSHKKQVLLFLNRRGTARAIVCQNCGWQAMCPHCHLPVTYHHTEYTVRCHTCGYSANTPTSCPECQSTEILFKVPGTKAVVAEIEHLFPEARIARFDSDNLTADRLDKHLGAIKNGEIDIIIGTQMLVKGFDIPKLSVVGLVNADTSLSFPDFSAEEKTFQLVTQAIGRVGRGHGNSTVIIQTYRPDNLLLKAAIQNDWSTFYQQEIDHRKKLALPPFTHVLKLECSRATDASASKTATNLAGALNNLYKSVTVLGPAPAFRNKVGAKFVWQLIVKSTDRKTLLKIIKNLPSGWKYDIDPSDLL